MQRTRAVENSQIVVAVTASTQRVTLLERNWRSIAGRSRVVWRAGPFRAPSALARAASLLDRIHVVQRYEHGLRGSESVSAGGIHAPLVEPRTGRVQLNTNSGGWPGARTQVAAGISSGNSSQETAMSMGRAGTSSPD